jgi:hypothetical protein
MLLLLVTTPIFGQDADTTDFEEEGGNEMFTSVDLSYSQDKGNTDFLSLYYGFSFSVLGDVGPLTDTEFSINFSRNNDKLDGEPFTDDQSLTSQFDLWANQRISPFLFFQQSYDKTIGLENRMNTGVGAKIGLFKGFSISYAFLAESEDYLYYDYTDSAGTGEFYYTDSTLIDPDVYYYDVYWGDEYYVYTDSSEYFEVTDSTEAPAESFSRHSIRPKIKLKLLDGNIVLDYRFYYKPRVDDFEDYLLEHELKITIATFYEALNIDLNYTNKYNSRYDGVSIINSDTGLPYSDVDENITFGVSFMF